MQVKAEAGAGTVAAGLRAAGASSGAQDKASCLTDKSGNTPGSLYPNDWARILDEEEPAATEPDFSADSWNRQSAAIQSPVAASTGMVLAPHGGLSVPEKAPKPDPDQTLQSGTGPAARLPGAQMVSLPPARELMAEVAAPGTAVLAGGGKGSPLPINPAGQSAGAPSHDGQSTAPIQARSLSDRVLIHAPTPGAVGQSSFHLNRGDLSEPDSRFSSTAFAEFAGPPSISPTDSATLPTQDRSPTALPQLTAGGSASLAATIAPTSPVQHALGPAPSFTDRPSMPHTAGNSVEHLSATGGGRINGLPSGLALQGGTSDQAAGTMPASAQKDPITAGTGRLVADVAALPPVTVTSTGDVSVSRRIASTSASGNVVVGIGLASPTNSPAPVSNPSLFGAIAAGMALQIDAALSSKVPASADSALPAAEPRRWAKLESGIPLPIPDNPAAAKAMATSGIHQTASFEPSSGRIPPNPRLAEQLPKGTAARPDQQMVFSSACAVDASAVPAPADRIAPIAQNPVPNPLAVTGSATKTDAPSQGSILTGSGLPSSGPPGAGPPGAGPPGAGPPGSDPTDGGVFKPDQSFGFVTPSSGTGATQTDGIFQSAPGPGDRPHLLVRQLAEALTNAGNGQVDVHLSPEELGQVQMTLTTRGEGIALTILADRGETQELLRRHIDVLAQELRSLGYASVSFDFGQSRRQGNPAPHQDGQTPTLAASPPIVEADQGGATERQAGTSLDLRL